MTAGLMATTVRPTMMKEITGNGLDLMNSKSLKLLYGNVLTIRKPSRNVAMRSGIAEACVGGIVVQ